MQLLNARKKKIPCSYPSVEFSLIVPGVKARPVHCGFPQKLFFAVCLHEDVVVYVKTEQAPALQSWPRLTASLRSEPIIICQELWTFPLQTPFIILFLSCPGPFPLQSQQWVGSTLALESDLVIEAARPLPQTPLWLWQVRSTSAKSYICASSTKEEQHLIFPLGSLHPRDINIAISNFK